MSNYEFKMGMYLGELQQPFEESLATARDIGAKYVWCGNYSQHRMICELADDEIDKVVALVAAHDLEIFLLDSGGLLKSVHLAELQAGKMLEHEQFKRSSSCSSVRWRSHLGWGSARFPVVASRGQRSILRANRRGRCGGRRAVALSPTETWRS